MKKIFASLICLLLFCLCGCTPPDTFFPLGVGGFPNIVRQNEEITLIADLALSDTSSWIISLEGIPKNVVVEKGEKSEEFTTEKKYCVKLVENEKDIKVCFSFDTPGEHTIKVNAFQDNGQEEADGCYPQKYYTYTITVTE